MTAFLGAIGITAASAITVAMFTLRVALATRGRRLFAAGVAGVEAILFAIVLTGLVTNLGDPLRLGAYAVGVAGGTMLGLVVDARLNAGQCEVRVIVAGDGGLLLRRLHTAGWPATSTPAVGLSGRATSVIVTVDERRVPALMATLDGVDPAPFVSVAPLRDARPVRLPAGFVQVTGGRTWRSDRRQRSMEAHPAGGRARSVASHAEPVATDLMSATSAPGLLAGDPGIALRDLRLASAELGEALAATEPHGAIALAVAAWLGDVAVQLGRDLSSLPATPILLARGHAVVARSLFGVDEVADAPALAARARGLVDVLRSGLPTGPAGRRPADRRRPPGRRSGGRRS